MTYAKPLAIVAGIMLLLAIPSIWPYAYFQLLRVVVCVVGAILVYASYKSERTAWVWIMGIIAVVFNPAAPLYLSKGLWSLLDLVAAALMFAYAFTTVKASNA